MIGPPPPDSIPLSVLVVDGNRDSGDSLAELLRLYGHRVRVAYDAGGALRADPPDVVVLELRLPGTDGWELARRMQDREVVRPSLYIALTTCATGEDSDRSEAAGIDLHLVKPVEPAVLVGVLRRFARVIG